MFHINIRKDFVNEYSNMGKADTNIYWTITKDMVFYIPKMNSIDSKT